jgi:hypothetical protein
MPILLILQLGPDFSGLVYILKNQGDKLDFQTLLGNAIAALSPRRCV